ncbi:hypothetical protein AG4045_015277 [Apium graveolens]|uniref:Uncharacterized protein n=1 Tax=Apium graveolens TaxID=4045 RepID=A0A6L5BA88_APIGR|nr:hypothetical protein AG4045_015277 [Apium graveolens]
MRSHVIHPTDQEKLQKLKRLPAGDNGGINTLVESDAAAYGLREKPKKTYRFKDSTSVSEIEQEQEEVALCLIMLSKDVSNWSGLKSIGESSVNNSEFVDAQSFTKTEVEELEFQVSEVEIERTLINASKSDEESDLGTKKLIPSKRKEPDFVGPEYKVNNMEMIKIGCDQRRNMSVPLVTRPSTLSKHLEVTEQVTRK